MNRDKHEGEREAVGKNWWWRKRFWKNILDRNEWEEISGGEVDRRKIWLALEVRREK